MQDIWRIRCFIMTLLMAAALAISPGSQSAQGALTLDEVLKQLNSGAKQFRSITANFERTTVTVVVNDRSIESGQIEVRRDGKMRMDSISPAPRTILRDGDHGYLYNPKIKQVEEYDLSKNRSAVQQYVLLGFGTSGDSLQSSYSITLRGEETLDSEKVVRLELEPKSVEFRKQFPRIDLWLDKATWLPAQQEFHESGSGDYFTIRFTNVMLNVSIPDSQFKAHWPAGVTLVKPQG